MTPQIASGPNQDWRTADPIWADDARPSPTAGALSAELFAASAGFIALLVSVLTILA